MGTTNYTALQRSACGKASLYIRPFKVRPGDRFVLCCRVSTRRQDHQGNPRDQERNLRREVEPRLGAVIEVITHVGSGWDPQWLTNATAVAVQHGATLLAESTDRFLRSPRYHSSKRPDELPTEEDFERLLFWADDAPLMTFLHPDTSPDVVRSYQAQRGQLAKGRRGGQPDHKHPGSKKQRRLEKLSRVLWCHKRGASLGDIAAVHGLPRPTVQTWVREYGGGV